MAMALLTLDYVTWLQVTITGHGHVTGRVWHKYCHNSQIYLCSGKLTHTIYKIIRVMWPGRLTRQIDLLADDMHSPLISHWSPLYPGKQEQVPFSGEQDAPLLHWQVCRQPTPKRPKPQRSWHLVDRTKNALDHNIANWELIFFKNPEIFHSHVHLQYIYANVKKFIFVQEWQKDQKKPSSNYYR